jgi:hypothetical protein
LQELVREIKKWRQEFGKPEDKEEGVKKKKGGKCLIL